MRDAIHVHGLVRLKCDPGITKLSADISAGRIAKRLHSACLDVDSGPDGTAHLDDFKRAHPHDIYVQSTEDLLTYATENRLNINFNTLLHTIQKGTDAESRLRVFHDYLITSQNMSSPLIRPNDLNSEERSEYVSEPAPHPCSSCHDHFPTGGPHTDQAVHDTVYCKLCNATLRHRHNKDYCIRDGKCRFGFPRRILNVTTFAVIQKKYSRGPRAGQLRRTSVDILPATNDRWLNNHSRVALQMWGANLDISMLCNLDAQLNYVAKYGTKRETNSKGFMDIFRKVTKRACEADLSTAFVLRSLFLKTNTGREKTQQETSHLALSLSMVESSLDFVYVGLQNLSTPLANRRNTNAVDANEPDDTVDDTTMVGFSTCF